jgi:hypothetical protein
MDFRSMYLLAMRDQAPEQFKELAASNQLEQMATLKVREAKRLMQQLTQGLPRDKAGNLPMNLEREAEEQVRAQLLDFPQNQQTTDSQDEMRYLFGGRPLVSPE